jgi:hypothetical protein
MNASTTPSHDRRSHHAIAQIWQFGIPRADSLRIRRHALLDDMLAAEGSGPAAVFTQRSQRGRLPAVSA